MAMLNHICKIERNVHNDEMKKNITYSKVVQWSMVWIFYYEDEGFKSSQLYPI
jgi:hypothetical protein